MIGKQDSLKKREAEDRMQKKTNYFQHYGQDYPKYQHIHSNVPFWAFNVFLCIY